MYPSILTVLCLVFSKFASRLYLNSWNRVSFLKNVCQSIDRGQVGKRSTFKGAGYYYLLWSSAISTYGWHHNQPWVPRMIGSTLMTRGKEASLCYKMPLLSEWVSKWIEFLFSKKKPKLVDLLTRRPNVIVQHSSMRWLINRNLPILSELSQQTKDGTI